MAIIFVALAIIAFPLLVSCGGGDAGQQIRIGVAVPTATHGWTGGVGWWAAYTVQEIQRQNPELNFRIVHSGNSTQQVSDVENLVAWGIDYLVILPFEAAPLTEPVRQYASEGVRVVVVDRGLDRSDFGYVYVAGDNPGLGRISGEWLRETMSAEGLTNYVAMGGMPVPIDTERMDAFFAEMNRNPSLVNLLGGDRYEFANWSPQDGLRIMETFLLQYPRIDAVFCQDDDVLLGVMQAIMEARRTDIQVILGGAGSRPVYELIMEGHPLVRASGTYHPSMIADGIQYAVDVALGRLSADPFTATQRLVVVLPTEMVTAQNVRQFYNPDSSF